MSEPSIKTTREQSVLEKVEDAIIALLNQSLPNWVDIEPWPENPDDYDLVDKKGVVLVHYTGSRFVEAKDLTTNQMRGMGWALILKTRSFRGQYGAYSILEDIRQALQGQSFEGGGPVRMVRDDLVKERDGIWQWNTIITLPIPAVAKKPQRSSVFARAVTQNNETGE
jgi:hypothetical protein